MSTDEYVTQLVRYMRHVHKVVDEQHARVRADAQRAKLRELGPGTQIQVGDYCLVAKPLVHGVSKRLQRPNFDQVFQVVEVHGDGQEAKAFTLSDLKGKRTDLGFQQPVARERLTPIEMLPLAQPSEDVRTRISVRYRGVDRDGKIVNQLIDGKVLIVFDDDPGTKQCVDLATTSYRWL